MPAVLEGDDFHNPQLTGPRRGKEIAGGGAYSAYGRARISAPPKAVYDAILDVHEWSQWNRVVRKVSITKTLDPHARGAGSHKRLQGGTCCQFYVRMPPSGGGEDEEMRVREVVTLVERLKTRANGQGSSCVTRIRWRLDNAAISTPGFLLKVERINEIEELKDGTTEYRTWMVFSGPVAKMLRKRLELPARDRMQEWCADLKTWVERKHAAAGDAGLPA